MINIVHIYLSKQGLFIYLFIYFKENSSQFLAKWLRMTESGLPFE